MSAIRVDLDTRRSRDDRREPVRGDRLRAGRPDHSRVVLADGYTIGDIVLYEVDADGARQVLYGTPLDEREEGRDYPLSGLGSDARHGERRGNPRSPRRCSTTPAVPAYIALEALVRSSR